MDNIKADKNLMNGKGEEDVQWITANGAHIPIKEGESKQEAVKEHFKEVRQKGNIVHRLGYIEQNSVAKQVLGNRLISLEFGISDNYQKHIEKGHGDVFATYNKNLSQIINNPDMIFEGNKPNRVVMIKRIDRQVEIVLELSINEKNKNQIISMWTTTNKYIKTLTNKYKTLYKRHNV